MTSSWIWLFWLGFVLLSCTFLFQPERASFSSVGDFAVFAVAPAIALAIAPLGRAWLTLDRLALLCVSAAILAGLVGAYGLTLGIRRVTAPNLSPIHFADLAVILGFMGLAVTLVSRSSWRWIALAGPLLGVAASVAAGTRSALVVGCVLAALYAVFFIQQRTMPLWQKVIMPAILMALVVAAFYLAHLAGYTRAFDALHAIWGTITGDLSGDASTANRIEMFRAGWLAFLDRPLVGHGWHNQLQAAMPYLSEAAQRVYARQDWGYIHNEPLSLAVAAGIPGIVAYCLFIAAPFAALAGKNATRRGSPAAFLATTFVAGLVISGMTDVLFMVELPKLLLVVMTACLFWLKEAEENYRNG